MPVKKEVTARVRYQSDLAPDIFDLLLETDLSGEVLPGQFVAVYCRDGARILPRPISVCDADIGEGTIRLVYRVVGAGTGELARLRAGDEVRLLGPLGNGFPIREAAGGRVVLVGGGLGVPPMLYLFKRLLGSDASDAPASVTAVLGYRSRELSFLDSEFISVGETVLASDDGTIGRRGTVVDAMRAEGLMPDLIFSCGPKPMLEALAAYCSETEKNIRCYVSLEERMACGVGACLGCVAPTNEVNDHSRVRNVRICADGPVFDAGEIDWRKMA